MLPAGGGGSGRRKSRRSQGYSFVLAKHPLRIAAHAYPGREQEQEQSPEETQAAMMTSASSPPVYGRIRARAQQLITLQSRFLAITIYIPIRRDVNAASSGCGRDRHYQSYQHIYTLHPSCDFASAKKKSSCESTRSI